MPTSKPMKHVGITVDQVAPIDDLETCQGSTVTAIALEAFNGHTSVQAPALDNILDRLQVDHGDVIDRLART